jgi:hypothetical protein
MNPVEDASAEALLSSLKTIAATERRKHASVFNYWLSIRRDRQFPPIRDLDPLEISDAGPYSVLLEMIGAEDADIRHVGQAIKLGIDAEKLSDAPSPSLLSCIATRIPIVAACKEAFAFEDAFEAQDGTRTRCWVTLLPFSATGAFIDYVYGFVSLDPPPGGAEDVEEAAEPTEEPAEPVEAEVTQETVETIAEAPEPEPQPEEPAPEPVAEIEPEPQPEPQPEPEEPEPEPIAEEPAQQRPGFSAKLLESLANVSGFYGKNVQVDPDVVPVAEVPEEIVQEPAEEIAEQPEEIVEEPAPEIVEDVAEEAVEDRAEEPPLELTESPTPPSVTGEATLQDKLTDVRAKADEARAAKLRANVALYEGLSAAYDFALDAEDSPEEYLRLVEAQGLKIQLRSPMKPVVKLAFDGLCDDATIKQLEAILAWAFDEELPRGSLAERIEAAGGIGPILNGQARAA